MSDRPAKFIFAHTNTYSLTGNSKNISAGAAGAEGERLDGACPHVANPMPPTIIEGMKPTQVIELIKQRVEAQNKRLRHLRRTFPTQKGEYRAIRRDTHVLVASVYSFPDSIETMIEAEYQRWREDAIAFAKADAAENGAEVMSIFEHRDESHPHLHVFAVPICNGDNLRMDAKKCHAGHRAQNHHKKTNMAGPLSQSFKHAMKGWQDRYHEAVGGKHGQSRTGPKRRRLDRAAWKAEQERLGAQKKTEQALRREAEANKAAEAAEARKKAALNQSVSRMIEEAELAHIIANEGLVEALKHQKADPKLIDHLTAAPSQPPRTYDPDERIQMRPRLYPAITEGIDRLHQPPDTETPLAGFGALFVQISDWVEALAASRPRWLPWGDLGQEVCREVKRAFGLEYAPMTLARAIEQTPAWTGLAAQARVGSTRALGVGQRLGLTGKGSSPSAH